MEAADDEIRHFMAWVGRHDGIWLSPEGAATLAGARRAGEAPIVRGDGALPA